MAQPPPYTMDQIHAMTTHEERLRARAELTSYIVRMKKENQERLAQEAHVTNGHPGYAGGYKGSGPHRGGSTYSRGGHLSFHPYQRQGQFKNKSVTFNKPDVSTEKSEVTKEPAVPAPNTYWKQERQQTEPMTLCSAFTLTGICARHGCRYVHDPEKLAICKRWLFKGDCANGSSCSLSHEPSPHNAPHCLHFQDGRCNNESCRFAHIRINPSAPNCEAFGVVGYCEKGAECAEFHAHECPHFSNTGVCHFGDKCRLGHVRRASRMKKTVYHVPEDRSLPSNEPQDHTAGTKTPRGESSKSNSPAARTPQDFTQQVDFVSLDSDD